MTTLEIWFPLIALTAITLVTPSVLATMAVRIAPFMLMRWWM